MMDQSLLSAFPALPAPAHGKGCVHTHCPAWLRVAGSSRALQTADREKSSAEVYGQWFDESMSDGVGNGVLVVSMALLPPGLRQSSVGRSRSQSPVSAKCSPAGSVTLERYLGT